MIIALICQLMELRHLEKGKIKLRADKDLNINRKIKKIEAMNIIKYFEHIE